MPQLHDRRWKAREGPAANARRQLPALVSEYFARVRKQLAGDSSPDELHGLRLATKQLRYTLELFRACYGPGLETRLEELRELQRVLGEVADCRAAAKTLGKRVPTNLKTAVEKRAEEKAREFRTHWTTVFDTPGKDKWWTGYLSHNTRSR